MIWQSELVGFGDVYTIMENNRKNRKMYHILIIKLIKYLDQGNVMNGHRQYNWHTRGGRKQEPKE